MRTRVAAPCGVNDQVTTVLSPLSDSEPSPQL